MTNAPVSVWDNANGGGHGGCMIRRRSYYGREEGGEDFVEGTKEGACSRLIVSQSQIVKTYNTTLEIR